MNLNKVYSAPIYKALKSMGNYFLCVFKEMPTYGKEYVGKEMSHMIIDLIKKFIKVYHLEKGENRNSLLIEMYDEILSFETYLEICHGGQLMSVKKEAVLGENISDIKRQMSLWMKYNGVIVES